MTTPTLERIETDIAQLSLTEQLWLMERLAHRIRHASLRPLRVQGAGRRGATRITLGPTPPTCAGR
jgi:hypothetical protein